MVEAKPAEMFGPAEEGGAAADADMRPAEEQAEDLKNQGNEALKAKDADKAIDLYSQAINICKNEGILTNRAVAYIQKRRFKEALLDCEMALYLNPNFAKAHLRAHACYLSQGMLTKAKEAMQGYIDLTPQKTDADKQKLAWIDELMKYENFVTQAMERKEFRESSFYANKLIEQCPDSVKHMVMKIESDIRRLPNDMTDPIKYTTNIQERFIDKPEFLFWRGRVLLYNGQTDIGKKHVRQALSVDPDNAEVARFWRALRDMENTKTQANEAQTANQLDVAVALYEQCLDFDPMNAVYNQTILFNRACALAKLGKNEEALADLDKAIAMNSEYAKAYIKKGDIKLEMERFDEAIGEYSKVKQFAPQTPGLGQKLRRAQIELKKSKRKNFYKILDVPKDADEGAIKKAYRKKAVVWHPDKHAGKTDKEKAEVEEVFKDIGEAYSVLSDPKKRQMFDDGADLEEINQGGMGGGGMGGMDPNDVFRMFFGGGMGGGRGGGGASFHFQ